MRQSRNRYDALDALSEQDADVLEVADSDFYAYPDDLTVLQFDYVAKHPETFGPVTTWPAIEQALAADSPSAGFVVELRRAAERSLGWLSSKRTSH